jgi:hypothetical protein
MGALSNRQQSYTSHKPNSLEPSLDRTGVAFARTSYRIHRSPCRKKNPCRNKSPCRRKKNNFDGIPINRILFLPGNAILLSSVNPSLIIKTSYT